MTRSNWTSVWSMKSKGSEPIPQAKALWYGKPRSNNCWFMPKLYHIKFCRGWYISWLMCKPLDMFSRLRKILKIIVGSYTELLTANLRCIKLSMSWQDIGCTEGQLSCVRDQPWLGQETKFAAFCLLLDESINILTTSKSVERKHALILRHRFSQNGDKLCLVT